MAMSKKRNGSTHVDEPSHTHPRRHEAPEVDEAEGVARPVNRIKDLACPDGTAPSSSSVAEAAMLDSAHHDLTRSRPSPGVDHGMAASSPRTMAALAMAAAAHAPKALIKKRPPRPTCVAYAPGKGAVTADDNGDVNLWDDKEKLVQLVGSHPSQVKATYVAVAQGHAFVSFYDGSVKVWDVSVANGPVVIDFANQHSANHECWVVAVSDDGKLAVSATNGGEIILWQVDLPNKKFTVLGTPFGYPDSDDGVAALAFVPPAAPNAAPTQFLSGHGDGTLVLWDITDPKAPAPDTPMAHGNSHQVNCIAVAAGGKTAVSASLDMTVRRWDLVTQKPAYDPPLQHDDFVWRVAVSPDGKTIASASQDGTVRVWDMTNTDGKVRKTIKQSSSMGVAFADNTHVFFTTEKLTKQVAYRTTT
jgi:WD40 repeat protein